MGSELAVICLSAFFFHFFFPGSFDSGDSGQLTFGPYRSIKGPEINPAENMKKTWMEPIQAMLDSLSWGNMVLL